jgi:three-Cys-motif partner protein
MSKYDDNFFEDKRPWSVIKDTVLGDYMNVYLPKVNKRGQPIVLIDGYAGPGIFDDHAKGSPFIICEATEKYAKGKYIAFFFNLKKDYYERLDLALSKAGYNARSLKTNSLKMINQLPRDILMRCC